MNEEQGSHETASSANRTWIIAGLILLAVAGLRTVTQGSTWLHLATGKFVSGDGIPRTASWSLTAGDESWIADTWLYDLILYKLWAIGPGAATLVHIALVVAAFILLLPTAIQYSRGIAPALGLMLCTWLMLPAFEISPRIFSLIFPALFLAVLTKQRPAGAFWLTLLVGQVLWTNIHGSFWVGPLLCAAFALQACRVKSGPYSVKQLLTATGLTALVTLANPYGPALLGHIATLTSAPGFASGMEWISPFHTHFGNSLLKNLTTAILVVGAIGLATYRQKLPLALTCIAIAAAASATMYGKGTIVSIFIPLMSLLTFPFICLSISAGTEVITRKLENSGLSERSLSTVGSGIAAIVFVVSTGMIFSNQYYRVIGSAAAFGLGVNSDTVPARAAEVIGHVSFPERAANLPIDGGYLAYQFPERKIFADQRPRVQDARFHDAFLLALRSPSKEAQDFWFEHDIEAIIINTLWRHKSRVEVDGEKRDVLQDGRLALAQLLGGGSWRLAYFDGTTAILVRNSTEQAAFFDAIAPERQAGLDAIQDAHTSYCEAIQSLLGAPVGTRLLGAGGTFFVLQRYREAYAALEPVVLNSPAFHNGWFMLGFSQLQLGEYKLAIRSLNQACDGNPKFALAWLWLSRASSKFAGNEAAAARAYQRAFELDPVAAKRFGNPMNPDAGTGSPPSP